MKIRILITMCFLLTFLTSCYSQPGSVITGSGDVVAESREVSNMKDSVALRAPGELLIIQGETETLTIEAEDNVLGVIGTRIENGKLIIELTAAPNTTLDLKHPITYRLTSGHLSVLELAGTGNITASDFLAEHLKVFIDGGGIVNLAGSVTSQEVEVKGSGIYRAGNLESKDVKIQVTGGGDLTVWTKERLEVNCKGACSVGYYGKPELTREIRAIGTVISLGEK